MSDTKILRRDWLTREDFIKRLCEATSPIGPSLNDLTDHDADQRAELQRLTTHCEKLEEAWGSENSRHIKNCERLVQQDAEIQRLITACDNKDVLLEVSASIIERLKPFEDLVQKAIQTIATLQAGYAEKVQECARLERERDEARSYGLNYMHATQTERAETETELAHLSARLEAAEAHVGEVRSVFRSGYSHGYDDAIGVEQDCGDHKSLDIENDAAIDAAMSATQEGKE